MIRKLFFITILGLSTAFLNAQVFNTAEILKPVKFSVGVAPVYMNENLGIIFMGGVGIKSGVDFSLKYAVLENEDYFGADLEWKLLNQKKVDLSLTTGCHNYYDFGLDVSGNASFRIKSDIAFYTGLDMDLNFGSDLYIPIWIPVGIEIKLSKPVAFLFEAEIPLTEHAYPVIDGGFAFYF